MLVLLNSRANAGRARGLWAAVRPEIRERLGDFDVEEVSSPDRAGDIIRGALAVGESAFVAAGGDGTVNSMAEALLRSDAGGSAVLGAIGLGSSNDFHKTEGEPERVAGVPVRLDFDGAAAQDVIRIDVESADGTRELRFAVLNASLGVTAEANARFNQGSRFVRCAGRLSVDAGIVAAVIETLATHRDIPCRVSIDGRDEGAFQVSNLAVIKSPHFAGSFCYDTPVLPDDGLMGVNLCERLTGFQTLATLAALSKGRFKGRPKTRTWIAKYVRVVSSETFALETDGEIGRAKAAEFSVMPGALRCCA